MSYFSKRSLTNLKQCHPDLQVLFNEVIQIVDCAVICGHRNQKDQNSAFNKGFSKVRFPNSKHNTIPSMAADVVPWPIDWQDIERFKDFGKFVTDTADRLFKEGKIANHIEWGGTWNWKDYPHYQIKA